MGSVAGREYANKFLKRGNGWCARVQPEGTLHGGKKEWLATHGGATVGLDLERTGIIRIPTTGAVFAKRARGRDRATLAGRHSIVARCSVGAGRVLGRRWRGLDHHPLRGSWRRHFVR